MVPIFISFTLTRHLFMFLTQQLSTASVSHNPYGALLAVVLYYGTTAAMMQRMLYTISGTIPLLCVLVCGYVLVFVKNTRYFVVFSLIGTHPQMRREECEKEHRKLKIAL